VAKSDPNLLTISEYARSRKARGLSGGTKQAVHKAIAEGRIRAFGPDKLIDRELADRDWDRNTRARVAVGGEAAASAGEGAPADLVDAAGLADPPPAAAPAPEGERLHADPGYLRSRAAQAAADARIAEMKAAELEGSLVRVDQVRAELASRLAPVREALLQLPSRLASQLAAQADPSRVQTLLEAEIHQVLAPLARSAETTETPA
jgi:hypothetical protein